MKSGRRDTRPGLVPSTGLAIAIGMAVAAVLGVAGAASALCDAPQPGDIWSAQFTVISGSGDWTVSRVGATPQHLEIVAESDGLLTIGCNGNPLDPATGVLAATVMNDPDVLVESGDVSGEATLGMQAMALAGTNRDTVDVAAAFFPYASGWIGGRFDGGGTLLEGNPAPGSPDAPVVSRVGTGHYEVRIPGVVNSYADGMLYAIVDGTAENVANTYALDPTDGSPGTGEWTVYSRDNQGSALQDRGIRFVYIPWTAGTTFGRVDLAGGTLNVVASSSDTTFQRIGIGQVRLDVDDASPEEGMLLIMGGNSFSNPDDNLYRYDVDEEDSLRRFVIVNRDQPTSTSGSLSPQDSEFVFTYVPFPPHVVDEVKLGSTTAGGPFDPLTRAGAAIARIGDLDGDGVPDQAVGAASLGGQEGELLVLFMQANGTVKSSTVIKSDTGGLAETFTATDRFGEAVASLGDVDGDGVIDLAVSAVGRSGDEGAVWVLFMNANGTVRDHQEISSIAGGFSGGIDAGDLFGSALAGIGDLNGDRVPDLVVGAAGDLPGPGSASQGSIWVLHLGRDGTVVSQQQVGDGVGGFMGTLGSGDLFGTAVAAIGDVTGDGVPDVAVGAPGTANDGGALLRAGSVWVLGLNPDGTVASETEIPRLSTGFDFAVQNDRFGSSVTAVGDLNGDGTQDLAVGARTASSDSSGQVFIVYLGPAQEVLATQRIGEEAGGFMGEELTFDDEFGWSVGALGDLDGDGVTELSVGQFRDTQAATTEGATWTVFLAGATPVCSDGVLDPSEACDDAGLAPGDGCSTTCTAEQSVSVIGTAQGGSVSVVVDGTLVSVPTFAGQSAFVVASTLALAISTDPALGGAGTYGADEFVDVSESLVWTNGLYTAVASSDPGITVVPEPGAGVMLFAGATTLVALRRRARV